MANKNVGGIIVEEIENEIDFFDEIQKQQKETHRYFLTKKLDCNLIL